MQARVPLWYRLAWHLALPWVAAYLAARSLRQREYLRHWGERFLGRGPAPDALPYFAKSFRYSPYPAFSRSSFGMNRSEAEFMQ